MQNFFLSTFVIIGHILSILNVRSRTNATSFQTVFVSFLYMLDARSLLLILSESMCFILYRTAQNYFVCFNTDVT